MDAMNIRQSRFAELVVSGVPASRAYAEAGYSNRGRSAEANTTRLMKNDEVKTRIAELRKKDTKAALMTRDEKRRIAASIARDETASGVDRLRACAEDYKLAGHYEPEKHVVDAGPKTLDAIRERARKMVSPLSRAKEAQP